MNARHAVKFLYWAGEKLEAGDKLTEDEQRMFVEAKQHSLATAKKFLRLTPEDWKYTPGEPFK